MGKTVLVRKFGMNQRIDKNCPESIVKLRLVGPQRRRYVMPYYNVTPFVYADYLASRHWAKIRAEVLRRDEFRCKFCFGHRSATQVHHLTYERIGREWTRDLISICADCHRKHHGVE